MKFPLVSRARLDDALARVDVLERSLQQWVNAYLAAKGLEPVDGIPATLPGPISVQAQNPPAAESTREKPPVTMATFDRIETVANEAAAHGAVADWLSKRRKVSA